MPVQASLATKRKLGPNGFEAPERRFHKRFPLSLVGRFMRADRHEFTCRLVDISVGGMAVNSPVQPDPGENVIVYIDELGGLEGQVARHFEGGFAIALSATLFKRDKLAARITWLINRHELSEIENREHERRLPGRNTNTLKLNGEITLQVQVMDVSLSGANVVTEACPPVGSEVYLGKLRAEVVRYHDRGIGVRFLPVQDVETIQQSFDRYFNVLVGSQGFGNKLNQIQ